MQLKSGISSKEGRWDPDSIECARKGWGGHQTVNRALHLAEVRPGKRVLRRRDSGSLRKLEGLCGQPVSLPPGPWKSYWQASQSLSILCSQRWPQANCGAMKYTWECLERVSVTEQKREAPWKCWVICRPLSTLLRLVWMEAPWSGWHTSR